MLLSYMDQKLAYISKLYQTLQTPVMPRFQLNGLKMVVIIALMYPLNVIQVMKKVGLMFVINVQVLR